MIDATSLIYNAALTKGRVNVPQYHNIGGIIYDNM